MPNLTAFVSIASQEVHETGVEQGLACWIGYEAQRIIQEIRKGRIMTTRI